MTTEFWFEMSWATLMPDCLIKSLADAESLDKSWQWLTEAICIIGEAEDDGKLNDGLGADSL